MRDKTGDYTNEAVEVTLQFGGAETGGGELPSNSNMRDKASKAANWLLSVFQVFITSTKQAKFRPRNREDSLKYTAYLH